MVRDAAFMNLLGKKESHSKLKNLQFYQFEMQDYLMDARITINQARVTFKYRTRMSNFWKNFKGNSPPQICPLCRQENSIDSQEHSLKCETIKRSLNVDMKLTDIYDNVTPAVAKDLERLEQYRETFLDWLRP